VVQSAQSREWKNRAGWLARQQGAEILTGPVAVSITLHPKLTKHGNISKIRLDIDNVTKPTLDALNGIMWEDDKQIVALHIVLGHPLPDGGLTLSVFPGNGDRGTL
jgi:crossover junction endodeoxyribonuclease RusA